MPDYDYCIAGAGCAGLSLLMRMLEEPSLQQKKILLVDRGPKTTNDRTWCFWEKGEGFFESIVYHRWAKLWFHDQDQSRLLDTHPFLYKIIRGIDFYNYCFDTISRFNNVSFMTGDVQKLYSDGHSTYVVLDDRKITATQMFNSIPAAKAAGTPRDWRLLQHFKGWVIRSLRPAFNPGEATIMDFRTSQQSGTCFFYVMPLFPDQALVECTFFSEHVLPESEYTDLLTHYISTILKINDYVILERELGVIPMTTAVYPQRINNIWHVGAAAGLTKPSSGYTFQFIQQDSARIVHSLISNDSPRPRTVNSRFRFYDRILLNVLVTKKLSGQEVFSSLFGNSNLPDLLYFLDNASTPSQDWKIIRTLPKRPFFLAALRELLRRRPPRVQRGFFIGT